MLPRYREPSGPSIRGSVSTWCHPGIRAPRPGLRHSQCVVLGRFAMQGLDAEHVKRRGRPPRGLGDALYRHSGAHFGLPGGDAYRCSLPFLNTAGLRRVIGPGARSGAQGPPALLAGRPLPDRVFMELSQVERANCMPAGAQWENGCRFESDASSYTKQRWRRTP